MEEKNNGLTIILIVVIVALLGFGAFYLITQNNAPKQPVTNNTQNTPTTPVVEEVDEEDTVLPIASTLELEGNTNTLFTLLEETSLDEALNDSSVEYTIFAPIDEAFSGVNPPAESEAVANILTYHVIKGNILAADVIELDGKDVETLNGDTLKITVVDGEVFLNGTIRVIDTDIPAENGVIHLIDGVLLPQ